MCLPLVLYICMFSFQVVEGCVIVRPRYAAAGWAVAGGSRCPLPRAMVELVGANCGSA